MGYRIFDTWPRQVETVPDCGRITYSIAAKSLERVVAHRGLIALPRGYLGPVADGLKQKRFLPQATKVFSARNPFTRRNLILKGTVILISVDYCNDLRISIHTAQNFGQILPPVSQSQMVAAARGMNQQTV